MAVGRTFSPPRLVVHLLYAGRESPLLVSFRLRLLPRLVRPKASVSASASAFGYGLGLGLGSGLGFGLGSGSLQREVDRGEAGGAERSGGIGLVHDEDAHCVAPSVSRRRHQRRPPLVIGLVYVGAIVDQERDAPAGAGLGRGDKRRRTRLRAGLVDRPLLLVLVSAAVAAAAAVAAVGAARAAAVALAALEIKEGRQLLLVSCAEGAQTSGAGSLAAGRLCAIGYPALFGYAPCSANAHTDSSSSVVAMSSGGTSEPSFDEARRRFSPGIFMAVLPGRFAQHDKDIGRGRGEANRARP